MVKPMPERSYVCNHNDKQRQILGLWCTRELEKAVEKRYCILHIDEVWDFPEMQTGFFANYVNKWLKIKQEASGWPSHGREYSKAAATYRRLLCQREDYATAHQYPEQS